MSEIYIGFVDTPGIFASIIRRVIRQKYIHVVMAMDPELGETYSVGRRNPAVPFFAGFVKEDKYKVFRKFPHADYMVCRVRCTREQKTYLRETLQEALRHRFRYHYAVLELPLILFQIPFQSSYHYTCSSYLAKIMQDAGIIQWKKHTSLVTPKDFYEDLEKEVLFEGPLAELIGESGAGQWIGGASYE